jgi:hypothetical protein
MVPISQNSQILLLSGKLNQNRQNKAKIAKICKKVPKISLKMVPTACLSDF